MKSKKLSVLSIIALLLVAASSQAPTFNLIGPTGLTNYNQGLLSQGLAGAGFTNNGFPGFNTGYPNTNYLTNGYGSGNTGVNGYPYGFPFYTGTGFPGYTGYPGTGYPSGTGTGTGTGIPATNVTVPPTTTTPPPTTTPNYPPAVNNPNPSDSQCCNIRFFQGVQIPTVTSTGQDQCTSFTYYACRPGKNRFYYDVKPIREGKYYNMGYVLKANGVTFKQQTIGGGKYTKSMYGVVILNAGRNILSICGNGKDQPAILTNFWVYCMNYLQS